MERGNRVLSKEEIKKEIQSYLDQPLQVKGKDGVTYSKSTSLPFRKRTLTKWIEQTEDYYNHVLKAYQCPLNERYYLGDFITCTIVVNAKRDLEVMKEMRAELDKKEGA